MYSKEDEELAEKVKPGDTWVVNYGRHEKELALVKIGKVTKTQIIIQDNKAFEKFRRNTGTMIGDCGYYATPYILPGTPERIEEAKAFTKLKSDKRKLYTKLTVLLNRLPSMSQKEIDTNMEKLGQI